MPVYEYRCKSCGKTHEIEHGFNDKRPTECSACGGELVRVFHPIGLVFKGSGFHKTDYAGSGRRPDAKPAAEKSGAANAGDSGSASGPSGESAKGTTSESKGSESKSSDAKSSGSKSTKASGPSAS